MNSIHEFEHCRNKSKRVSMHLIWKLFDVLTWTLIFNEIQLKSFLECIFVHVIFDTNSVKEKKNWNYYLMFHRFRRLSNLNYRKQIQYYVQYRDWKIFNSICLMLYVICYIYKPGIINFTFTCHKFVYHVNLNVNILLYSYTISQW